MPDWWSRCSICVSEIFMWAQTSESDRWCLSDRHRGLQTHKHISPHKFPANCKCTLLRIIAVLDHIVFWVVVGSRQYNSSSDIQQHTVSSLTSSNSGCCWEFCWCELVTRTRISH